MPRWVMNAVSRLRAWAPPAGQCELIDSGVSNPGTCEGTGSEVTAIFAWRLGAGTEVMPPIPITCLIQVFLKGVKTV